MERSDVKTYEIHGEEVEVLSQSELDGVHVDRIHIASAWRLDM